MAGDQNPRNQEEDDEPRFSTPMPGPSPASSLRLGSSLIPRYPSSEKKTVLLSDWWLLAAEKPQDDGKRLSIGGVVAGRYRRKGEGCALKSPLSPWQKAERIFESAPITERYDTFTLGTADGITVRIQGVINKARSRHNGFPLEVCSYFLIGFPYNWDDYADACFGENSNSSSVPASFSSDDEISKLLADAARCEFAVHLDEFSLSRIHDVNFIHDVPMGDFLIRKFRDFLERFCSGNSINPTTQMPSDTQNCTLPIVKSFLPHGTPCKYEREKISQNHDNGTAHVAEGDATGPSEAVGCHRNGLHADEVVGENSIAITANVQRNVSFDSSLHPSSRFDKLPVKGTCIQKVTLLGKITEPQNGIHLARSVPVGLDSVNCTLNCIGEAYGESITSLTDPGMERIPKEMSFSHPKHDKELGNERRSDGFGRIRAQKAGVSKGSLVRKAQNAGVSKGSLVRKVSDRKDAKSSRIEMNPPSEISSKPSIAIPSKASNKKEDGRRRSSRIASKLHPEILENIENSEFHVVEDSTAQIDSVDMRSNITSEMGLKEPLTEPVGKRDRLLKLKNFRKDQKCAECMDRKLCMHKKTATPCKSSSIKINQTKLDLVGKNLWIAMDKMFYAENDTGHTKRGNISPSVCKLHNTRRSGHMTSSSTISVCQYLDKRVMLSANERMENVEEIPATDAKSCLPQEIPSKYEREKNSQKNENDIDHVAEGHAAGSSKAVGYRHNDLHADGVLGENSIAITANIQHNVSFDSSLHLTSQLDRLPVEGTSIHKVTPLEKITEQENCFHLAGGFVPVGLDTVNHMPNCIGEANGESIVSLADPGIESVLNDTLPKEFTLSHPKRDRELRNVKRSDGSERIREHNVGVSRGHLVRKVSDLKDANSSRTDMKRPSEISSEPAIAISSKVSNKKEKSCRRSSRIASKWHPEILEKHENPEFHVVKDSTAHIDTVEMRSNIPSEVKVKKPLTEPVGRRERGVKLKNFQKDQKCAECMNKKLCMHKTTSTTRESAGNEINQSELKLIGKKQWRATDEKISAENDAGHMRHCNVSSSVVRKLHYTRHSGHMISSSIISESQCLGERVMFPANEGMENVEEIPPTDVKSCLPEETPSKYERVKISQKHENCIDHVAEPSKALGCHQNDLHTDGVVGENSIAITANIQHRVPFDSSMHLTSQLDGLPVEGMIIQKVTPLEQMTELKNDIHLPEFVSMGLNTVNGIPTCIGEANGKNTVSLAYPGLESVLNDTLPKEFSSSHPKNEKKLGNVKMLDVSERIKEHNVGVSRGLPVRKVSDLKDANSSRTEMNPPLEISSKPAIAISPEVEKSCRRSSRISSKRHPEILKNENSEFHVVKDSTAHIDSVDMRRNIASEVELTEPLTEPVGRRARLVKLKNFQKDQKCAECMGRKLCMHKTIATPREMVSAESDAAHMEHDNISPTIVCKLYYTSCSGRMISSSIISESQCLDKRVIFSANEGMENVEEILATDATKLTRMKKLKNRGGDDQTISSLNNENNVVRSVQVDHNFVKAANDVKHKHRQKSACYISRVRAVKCTTESSGRELDVNPVSTNKIQGGKGADDQTSVNSGPESEFFKCSDGNATQSVTMLEMRPSKEKKLDVIINKTRKKQISQNVNREYRRGRTLRNSGRTIWRPSYVNQSPLTRDMAKKLYIASPASLNLKRSRSGRLLVPPIATWCQKIIYSADGEITGITGEDLGNFPYAGNRSEPPMKKRKIQ